MPPDLHQQIRKLFEEALERPKADRAAFLATACAEQPEVLEAVSRLLAANVESGSSADQKTEYKSPLPEQIGRYLVTGELGRGSMGIVYEAIDPLINRTVAVKVIHLHAVAGVGDAQFLTDRLFREARSAGSLSHPGIVTIFDVGREKDSAFIAMEHVEGPSLHDVIVSSGKLEAAEALNILRQTAAALDYAHSRGVVHRDIKPANIMLDQGATVKITDFGIAKIGTAQKQTATGMVIGTPSYMSPEQIEQKPLDGRSDQFALAIVAYELLTGQCPFQAESLASLVLMIVFGDRPSARALDPSLPSAIDEVLGRGLNKVPGERFASCAEFASSLDAAFRSPPTAAPTMEPTTKEITPSDPLPAAAGQPIPIPVPNLPTGGGRKKLVVAGLLLSAAAGAIYKFVIPAPVKKPAPVTPISAAPSPRPPDIEQPTTPAPAEEKPAQSAAGPTIARLLNPIATTTSSEGDPLRAKVENGPYRGQFLTGTIRKIGKGKKNAELELDFTKLNGNPIPVKLDLSSIGNRQGVKGVDDENNRIETQSSKKKIAVITAIGANVGAGFGKLIGKSGKSAAAGGGPGVAYVLSVRIVSHAKDIKLSPGSQLTFRESGR